VGVASLELLSSQQKMMMVKTTMMAIEMMR
jgi:hypothetical protein